MRLSIWDEPALDFFVRSIEALSDHKDIEVVRANRRKCRDLLVLGDVDVALAPALYAFTEGDLFDLLPAVAFSTWDYPFLKLHLKRGLGTPIRSVAIDPLYAQEALVAQIILKEHYNITPTFHPYPDGALDSLMHTDDDAVLAVLSSYEEAAATLGEAFDVGRDWFELTNYPMVWGLFVTRKGEAGPEAVRQLRDIAHFTEIFKDRWIDEGDLPASLQAFYREGVRYRLDDMAIASLTAFQDYLYYTNVVDEIDPLVFYQVEEQDADDEDQPLL